jgi:hypothetical protein
MKQDNLDDYELFYMELPQADYLKDIEIQDDYENHDYDDLRGLSDEQVSEIARDSLDGTNQNQSQSDQSEIKKAGGSDH